MNKIKLMMATAAALTSAALPANAQSHLIKLTNHLEPYGFFRTSAVFDARDSKADVEDLFYYIPYDKEINLDGDDIWFNPSFKMSAITTRLGLNLTGFKYGSFNVTGRLETDFYLMTGGRSSLHLREAYLNLNWDNVGSLFNSVSVKVGQAWHPMSLGMPYTVGYEAGSPFNPYARSPQLMFEARMAGCLSLTAGLLYPMEFMPTGPQGPTADYVKYGLVPELYAGLEYSSKHLTARLGADFISLVPRWRITEADGLYYYDVGTKVNDRVSMVSPMAYLQFSKGAFKINAKAVFASGGDHLRLMGGYALYDKSDVFDYKYTPLRSATAFVSASYGSQLQFTLFAGGMKALGTSRDILTDKETGFADTSAIYYFDGGFKNIRYIARVSPAVSFHLDRLSVALEYNLTGVGYGEAAALSSRALAETNPHLIVNHRVLGIIEYSF